MARHLMVMRARRMGKTWCSQVANEQGFSLDRRKRRRQYRAKAKALLSSGGFFNAWSARGTSFGDLAAFFLQQARYT